MSDIRVIEYVDQRGRSPFAGWFDGLSAPAAAKVTAALYQLSAGNCSNVKGVGAGVFERKIDFGPGYRVYFGKDGSTLVILLGGSSKQRQQQAIEAAQERGQTIVDGKVKPRHSLERRHYGTHAGI